MKIKIIHPTAKYQAGLIVELPEDEAQELISNDFAFEIAEDVIEVTTLSDEIPHFIEGVKEKKVRHGNR